MTLNALTDEMRRDLSSLANERPEFEEFFRVFSRRERNASVTELDKLLQANELQGLRDQRGRALAIEFFRRLTQMGIGEFRVGRRKKPTRFIWNTPLVDVAATALDTAAKTPSPIGSDAKQATRPGDSRLLTHVYVLREDLIVRLDLPVDLTIAEAKRLSTFIQTLPLDQGKEE